MSQASALEAVRRFHDILILVSHEGVRTAYEVAQRLDMPLSSAYVLVAEMERLACLTRDESGYLLAGTRTHQMGLAACGMQVPAQHLAPLVRYLRDHTGETAFTARLTDRLVVGTVATGSSAHHVIVQAFQTYQLPADAPAADSGAVWRLTIVDPQENGASQVNQMHLSVHALALAHDRGTPPDKQLVMAVACTDTTDAVARNIARRLHEVAQFFDNTRERQQD